MCLEVQLLLDPEETIEQEASPGGEVHKDEGEEPSQEQRQGYYMAHPNESRKYMPERQVTHEDYRVIKERAPELLCDYWGQHT